MTHLRTHQSHQLILINPILPTELSSRELSIRNQAIQGPGTDAKTYSALSYGEEFHML